MPKPPPRTAATTVTMAAGQSHRPAAPPSGSWRLLVILIGVAVLAVAGRFAPQWAEKLGLSGQTLTTVRGIAAAVARWSTPVLIAVLVLAVLAAISAVVGSRHRAQADRLATAVARAVRATGPLDRLVRIGRGPTGRPRVVRVQLPADFPAEDHKERPGVEQAVARVFDGYWRGDWKPARLRKGRLTIRRGHPLPATDSDIESGTDKARMLVVARRIFGKTATVKSIALDSEGRAESFVLSFPPHPNLANPGFQDRVAGALTQLLPGLWEMDWDLQADTMRAHRRPMLAREIPYTPVPVVAANRLQLPAAAVAGQLEPGRWDLDGKTPHGLITGETGGGKTYAFLVLAVEALRRGLPVFGIDPKKIELMALENWPGMERLGTEPEEMAAIISYLHDLMMYRYTLLRERRIRRSDLWPVVVFIDELLILNRALNDQWAIQKAREGIKGGKDHPALGQLVSMVVLARSARIHLCFGVQRPQATLFDEGARDSIRFRLSLGRLTQEGAIQMWGDAHTGTAIPGDIPGRGTISTPLGPREAQVFRLPELDLETTDDQMAPQDAALRARLLAECAAAMHQRPKDLHLEIGGYVSPNSPASTPPPLTIDEHKTDPADEEVIMMPAKGLSPGLHVLVDDPDGPEGHQVEAVVEQVDDTTEEDRLLVDYRITDGRPGQLDLDPDEELPLAG